MSDRIVRLTAGFKEATTDEQGQGLVEYALILLLVMVAVVGTLTIVGTSVSALFQTVANAFP